MLLHPSLYYTLNAPLLAFVVFSPFHFVRSTRPRFAYLRLRSFLLLGGREIRRVRFSFLRSYMYTFNTLRVLFLVIRLRRPIDVKYRYSPTMKLSKCFSRCSLFIHLTLDWVVGTFLPSEIIIEASTEDWKFCRINSLPWLLIILNRIKIPETRHCWKLSSSASFSRYIPLFPPQFV